MHAQDQTDEHPGDAYARQEIEAWYKQHLGIAERDLARAAADGVAALGGQGDKREARQAMKWAREKLTEYEASYEQWTTQGTMPWRHSEMVSGVIGSIQGGLAAGFAPPITPTSGELAAMEAGLDPGMEPNGQLAPTLGAALGAPADPSRPPSQYALADREYKARWAVGHEAMGRMGLYRHGDPPTEEMHAEFAEEMADEDAWRVSTGQEPMWHGAVVEETQAALGLPVVRRPLPPPVFDDEEDVRRYCAAAHERLIDAATEVNLMVAQLRTKLEQIKDADGGLGARVKTRIVLAHLSAAARMLETAAAHSKKAHTEYRKHFTRDTEPRQRARSEDE